jgi:hypothetical protein
MIRLLIVGTHCVRPFIFSDYNLNNTPSAGLQIPRDASNFLRQQAQKIASFCCRACACGCWGYAPLPAALRPAMPCPTCQKTR